MSTEAKSRTPQPNQSGEPLSKPVFILDANGQPVSSGFWLPEDSEVLQQAWGKVIRDPDSVGGRASTGTVPPSDDYSFDNAVNLD